MASSDGKESLVGQLIGVHVAMISLAAGTVFSRFSVRWSLTEIGFGGDDITILISLVLAAALVATNLGQIPYGFGRHRRDLPKTTDFARSSELFFFGEMLYVTAVGTTRIAILILYFRIIPRHSKGYRYGLFGVLAFVVLTVVAYIFVCIFQCSPISFAWNKHQDGSCINQSAYFFSHAGLDIFQDLIIYALPTRVLYQLQLPRNQKLALIAIFIVGGFVCITGMLRLSALKTAVVTKDPTWYNVATANWSIVEVCVGIFCASLVHFKPLISRFAPHLIGPTKGSSLGGSAGALHSGSRTHAPRSQYIRAGPHYDIELLAGPDGKHSSQGSLSPDRIYVERGYSTTQYPKGAEEFRR